MNAELFHSSLDWHHAAGESMTWIMMTWALSALGAIIGLCLMRFTTRWGREFWAISGQYFTGKKSIKVWVLLGLLLLSVITAVRLSILFSYQGNDMFTSVQTAVKGMAAHNQDVKDSGVHGFWVSIKIFCIMACIHVIRVMADIYLTQHFIVRWRMWLTDHLTQDWLDHRSYYRAHFVGLDARNSGIEKGLMENIIDNPDQRIQQDIDIFTTGVGDGPNQPEIGSGSILLFGAIESIVSLISFAVILWNLSATLPIFGMNIPRAMFWIVIAYVLVATIVAFRIGRPLIHLSFQNELTNAAFRYSLVRIRDSAESIAFYRGEKAEYRQLQQRFSAIVRNYFHFVNRSIGFTAWNLSVSQTIVPLPWLLQAPRLFSGGIGLGDVTQTGSAFTHVQNGLSFFRNVYDDFAAYRAAIMRLHGLVLVNTRARQLPEITIAPQDDPGVSLDHISVFTPHGDPLITDLNLQLTPGQNLMVTGQSGNGKTTLFRTLAQLWPYSQGAMNISGHYEQIMFLSQLPYLPLGNLQEVICYPLESSTVSKERIIEVLNRVALSHLTTQLEEIQDWSRVLSPGEQQRIGFARLLLTQPIMAFLDESTSALDEGLELALYQLIHEELPQMIVVSISHRPSLRRHHQQELHLHGAGRWDLEIITHS